MAAVGEPHHHPLLARGRAVQFGLVGYTFPLGVYTVTTFRLGTVLHLAFFGVAGSVMISALAIMWLVVGGKTLTGAWKGHLFVSPCIATPL